MSGQRFIPVIVTLSGLLLTRCSCAPSIDTKNDWHNDENNDYNANNNLSPLCDPSNGRRCWDLLPSIADARDNYIVEQNEFYDRLQPLQARHANQAKDARSQREPLINPTDNQSRNPTVKTLRHAKKDMFMSRGWGAGGMPFSVLYMKPRANNHSSSATSQGETSKNTEQSNNDAITIVDKQHHIDSAQSSSSSTGSGRSNTSANRLVLRNNNNSGQQQPRRHYSIIPQLFISYGWGPSGK